MSLLCAASNRGDKRDSEWRHPPERARGPLPANPRAEFSQCGLLRNWRATIWRNERFWLEQAHPGRGHKRPLRAVQPGIERTEASEEYRNDWHRAAARWGGRRWVENRPRRLPADRYRRARNLLCRGRFLYSSGHAKAEEIDEFASVHNLCLLPILRKMLLVARDQEMGTRSFGAFEEAIIRFIGRN